MPLFIGLILSYLSARLGKRLAVSILIITAFGSLYAVFATVISAGLNLLEVPASNEMVLFAMEAFPATTPAQIAAIFAARLAQWGFHMQTAAINIYTRPQKSLL